MELSGESVIVALPKTTRPSREALDSTCVVLLDEDSADGPTECASADWFVPWGLSAGAVWSVWASVPDQYQISLIVALAAVQGRPLAIVVTEERYMADWIERIGPAALDRLTGVHVISPVELTDGSVSSTVH
jgi:hypothetical protein